MSDRHTVDPTAELAAGLYVALGRLVRSLRQEAPRSEVGPGGLSVLTTLGNRGSMRAGALAEAEGVAAASMTRIVNHLDDAGLVRRDSDPTDGRAQVVGLTPRGAQLLASGQEAKLAALRRRIDALAATDREALERAAPALTQLGLAQLGGAALARR